LNNEEKSDNLVATSQDLTGVQKESAERYQGATGGHAKFLVVILKLL
jgi:hypothetical protein